MDDMDGHHIIMNNVSAGGLFGEAYCFLGTDAPIYICAVTEAEVLWMRPTRVRRPASPSRSGTKCWPTGLWRLWPPAPSP